ncbi:MAG: exosome complex exonuclease Rrp41 [Nanoarchaeota archaeon]
MKEKSKARIDGRTNDQLRPIEAKIGVVSRADGSAVFKIGKTIAYAAVYGPRALHPKFLQNPEKGILRCNYNMMSFSGSGERVKPGPTRRSREISMVTEKALVPVLSLEQYPNAVVDVYVELLQTDSGTRCAGISAAAMALADAGIPMKDLISSVSVGLVNGNSVVDLTKEEEDSEGAVDIALAVMPRKKEVTLLQLDGILSKDQLRKTLELGIKACEQIYKIQQNTLKEKYKNE